MTSRPIGVPDSGPGAAEEGGKAPPTCSLKTRFSRLWKTAHRTRDQTQTPTPAIPARSKKFAIQTRFLPGGTEEFVITIPGARARPQPGVAGRRDAHLNMPQRPMVGRRQIADGVTRANFLGDALTDGRHAGGTRR